MMEPRCEACRFWHKTYTAEGQCRAHVPVITAGTSAWPITVASDWCGEYDPRPSVLRETQAGIQQNMP